MRKIQFPIVAGDTVEIVQQCRGRVRGSVLYVGSGLAEVTYRADSGKSQVAILDCRDLTSGQATAWAFDPAARRRAA
jgi:hypothetical protein